MSNVNLAIGGRNFTVACAAGEEAHVSGLGEMINAKIVSMGDFSSQSESRMLLFAALLLADEVHDAAARRAAQAIPDGTAERLGAIAEKLENLATRLEA
jgi:cell division protein ZapA